MIEGRAIHQLEQLLTPMLCIQRLPELSADFAIQPCNNRRNGSDQWLPIQLKASEAANVDAWLRQIKHQITQKLSAYHGSVVLGWNPWYAKVLVLPVHRLRHADELELRATHWWVHPSVLARTLYKHWKQMGFHSTTSLQLLATTNRNALMEGSLRAAFAGTFFEKCQRFKYEANGVEFTDVDGYVACLRTGAKLRCQEKTGKPKTRGDGGVIGLTISTARYVFTTISIHEVCSTSRQRDSLSRVRLWLCRMRILFPLVLLMIGPDTVIMKVPRPPTGKAAAGTWRHGSMSWSCTCGSPSPCRTACWGCTSYRSPYSRRRDTRQRRDLGGILSSNLMPIFLRSAVVVAIAQPHILDNILRRSFHEVRSRFLFHVVHWCATILGEHMREILVFRARPRIDHAEIAE